MAKRTKYDVVRWGQVDGERHAFKIIDHDRPTRSELEYLITGSRIADIVSIGGSYLSTRERAWYEQAYASEMRKHLTRAYNESKRDRSRRRPRRR